MAESDDSDTKLAEFLISNSELFTVFGVFGAIALYFVQIPAGDSATIPQRQILGFVMSLLLFLLIAFLIAKRAILEVGGFLALLKPKWKNVEIVAFLVAFTFLSMASVGVIFERYSSTAFLSLPLLAMAIGAMVILRFYGALHAFITVHEDGATFGKDPKLNDSSNRILIFATVLAGGTLLASTFVSAEVRFGLNYLYEPALGMDHVIMAFLGGVFIGTGLIFLLGISVKMLHYSFKHIIENDMEEEFKAAARTLGIYSEESEGSEDELPPYIR